MAISSSSATHFLIHRTIPAAASSRQPCPHHLALHYAPPSRIASACTATHRPAVAAALAANIPAVVDIAPDDQMLHARPQDEASSFHHELHCDADWSGLLDPLQTQFRREIVRYGEFAAATYDAFDNDPHSPLCGSCRFEHSRLFDQLGLARHGYAVSAYLYAMSHVELPHWLAHSLHADPWSRHSNWMGFVAVSRDAESGRRDIVVSWRGTVALSEWLEDFRGSLEPLRVGDCDLGDAEVERGFQSIYTSKSDGTRYNKRSASEQVMDAIKSLVMTCRAKGEKVSVTITGHSLGGALALLSAYEVASTLPDVPVRVMSFGAPFVGNSSFGKKLCDMGVRVLRVVIQQDIVPKMPDIFADTTIGKFEMAVAAGVERMKRAAINRIKRINTVASGMQNRAGYAHVGLELKLDIRSSPYGIAHPWYDIAGCHNLQSYLYLLEYAPPAPR